MKKLFALVLSFTLMISPFSSVMAQGMAGTDAFTDDVLSAGNTEGKKFYYLQAEALGAAASGANMTPWTCFDTGSYYSHVVFGAGGFIYLWSEIKTAKEANDLRKERQDRLKQLEQDTTNAGGSISQASADIQSKALTAKLLEEQHTLHLLEERKKGLEKAAVAYDIAAGIAAAEVITHYAAAPFSLWFGYVYCPTLPFLVPTIVASAIAAYGTYSNVTSAMAATGQEKLGIDSLAFATLLQGISVSTAGVFTVGVILPETRVGLFIAQAIFAEKLKDQFDDRINKAKGNIAKLQALLNQWQSGGQSSGGITPGMAGNNSGGGSGGSILPPGGSYTTLPGSGTTQATNTGCFSNTPNGVNISQAGCSNPIKYDTKLPDFKNPELSALAEQSLAYGNSLAAGDTKAASIQGQALMANAARIRAIREEQVSKAADIAKKNGVDLNQIIKDKESEMTQMMNSGSSGSGAGLASLGGATAGSAAGSAAGAANASSTANASNKGQVMNEIKMPVLGTGAGAVSSGDGSGMSDEEKDVIAANVDRNKSEYKANDGDSLFKVVSKTYIRNLDKILTRKKKNLDEDAQ